MWSFGAAVKLSDARAKKVPAQFDDPVNQLELMPYAACVSMHNTDAPYWQRFDDAAISATKVSHWTANTPRACPAARPAT